VRTDPSRSVLLRVQASVSLVWSVWAHSSHAAVQRLVVKAALWSHSFAIAVRFRPQPLVELVKNRVFGGLSLPFALQHRSQVHRLLNGGREPKPTRVQTWGFRGRSNLMNSRTAFCRPSWLSRLPRCYFRIAAVHAPRSIFSPGEARSFGGSVSEAEVRCRI
jgi:hypothetical protein